MSGSFPFLIDSERKSNSVSLSHNTLTHTNVLHFSAKHKEEKRRTFLKNAEFIRNRHNSCASCLNVSSKNSAKQTHKQSVLLLLKKRINGVLFD